jgi:hypothetical protein
MSTTKTSRTTAPPHATYAEKPVTELMEEYAAWLTAETGYAVDPRSVYLASALRGTFQKSEHNQQRIADAATAREQAKKDREQRKVEREAATKERAAKKAEREAKRIERARAILAATTPKASA